MRAACWCVMLACLGSGPVVALDLGRLFFTPAERARLDAERNAAPDLAAAAALTPPSVVEPAATPPAPPASVTVNGFVRRAHGPSTAWINGTPGTRAEWTMHTEPALRLAHDAVEIDEARTRARVKPGQTFDPQAGRVVEGFERSPAPAAGSP